MRLRNVKNKEEILNNCSFLIRNPALYRGKYSHFFSNHNPLHLEIGMGKGNFIYEMAKTYPEINFIGLEKYEKVIAKAISKIVDCPSNLLIIKADAELIETIFKQEISCLYLNFSDPWPKKRQQKKRLTSPDFLKKYETIFKNEKLIKQKTDNRDLFASSLVSLSNFGYILEKVSLDLENSDVFNIKTEYEEKFIKLGSKINYLQARKK